MITSKNFLLVSFLLQSVWIKDIICHDWRPLRFCKVRNPDFDDTNKFCDDLSKSTKIFCNYAVDRSHCLEKLLKGEADFAVFKVEDLLLASYLDKSFDHKLVITGEFRLSESDEHEFDMVVLISNQLKIESLSDLRGQRLCHPGFDENGGMYDFSEVFLQYFEETVVPEKCNRSLSVLENKIFSLSSFFNSACKPGSWSPDPSVDSRLKANYSNLCSNCQDSCTHRDLYWGQQGVITCLFDCSGNVAWVRQQDIQVQLKQRSSQQCRDVSYLCPNGTIQSITTTNPCIWISRPWPVLVSRKEIQADVSLLMSHINNSPDTYKQGTWEYKMRYFLNDNSFQQVYAIPPSSIINYLNAVPGFMKASKMQRCKGTGQDGIIKICIENEETKEKCNLLAEIAHIYSVDPEFECQIEENCIKSVAENRQDVFITSVENLAAVAKQEYLKPVLFQTTDDYTDLRSSSIVVPSHSLIRNINDLKGKKACFTKSNGLGWNFLLMILHENSLVENICDGTKVMQNFFSDVCIINHKSTDEIRSCFENNDNAQSIGSLIEDEAEGLRCITEGGGDVTFIDYNNIGHYLAINSHASWTKEVDKYSYNSICPHLNSSDDNCYLFRAAYGQILTRKNISSDREEEITSAFLTINSLLGEKEKSPKIFRLFSHYYDEKNVLFESSASQLESSNQFFKKARFIDNLYEDKITKIMDICNTYDSTAEHKSSSSLISNFVILYLLPLLSVFMLNFS